MPLLLSGMLGLGALIRHVPRINAKWSSTEPTPHWRKLMQVSRSTALGPHPFMNACLECNCTPSQHFRAHATRLKLADVCVHWHVLSHTYIPAQTQIRTQAQAHTHTHLDGRAAFRAARHKPQRKPRHAQACGRQRPIGHNCAGGVGQLLLLLRPLLPGSKLVDQLRSRAFACVRVRVCMHVCARCVCTLRLWVRSSGGRARQWGECAGVEQCTAWSSVEFQLHTF